MPVLEFIFRKVPQLQNILELLASKSFFLNVKYTASNASLLQFTNVYQHFQEVYAFMDVLVKLLTIYGRYHHVTYS